jgi:glycosyltransferase involved in cell wall biosynthesis
VRILMQSRRDLLSLVGGDTIQVLKTKEYLEKLGVRVDISLDLDPDLAGYDLVHVFNITRIHETYLQVRHAKRRGCPVAVSPIYHDLTEYYEKGNFGAVRLLYKLVQNETAREVLRDLASFGKDAQALKALWRLWRTGYREEQREVLSKADVIIPNSYMERDAIVTDFRMDHNYVVAYYAPSRHFLDASADPFVRRYRLEGFVLCVGRFGARKNQLGLIRALKDTDIPLVFVGFPFNRQYVRACRREAGDATIFLDWIPHEQLGSAYAAAKVHVLPSWFETCGLVNLEAGLAGCNVVSTDRGYTREYCKEYVWYCDPSSLSSIREAVLEAYASEKTEAFRKHVRESFDWEKTARATLEAYESVL